MRTGLRTVRFGLASVSLVLLGSLHAGAAFAQSASSSNRSALPPLVVQAPKPRTAAPAAVPSAGTAAVTEGTCGGLARPDASPAPMRLFHMSIAYLSVLFLLVAVTSVLPWGRW